MYFNVRRRPTRPAPKKTPKESRRIDILGYHTNLDAPGALHAYAGEKLLISWRFGDCEQLPPRLSSAGSRW